MVVRFGRAVTLGGQPSACMRLLLSEGGELGLSGQKGYWRPAHKCRDVMHVSKMGLVYWCSKPGNASHVRCAAGERAHGCDLNGA